MTKQDVVVVFASNGARIYHTLDVSEFSTMTNILINPVFPRGIPPHRWRLENGAISVVDETLAKEPARQGTFKRNYKELALCLALGALLGFLAHLI
jgi:hypothetical protein